jgi:hypothetical protein
MCLYRLHNYCIDQHLKNEAPLCTHNFNVEYCGGLAADGGLSTINNADITIYQQQQSQSETPFARELLGGGHHFNGVDQNGQCQTE